jgi:AbrB family looped-hinge helix DNA binding protein
MPVLTKVSELGKLNIPAQIRRQTGLERGGPVMMTVVAGEIRLRPVRTVLTGLQSDADAVFTGSGETVARFLTERRAEAAQDEAIKENVGRTDDSPGRDGEDRA